MEEDGKTGWVVMHALTRALQQEMGIAALSDAFGPTTISTLQARFQRIDAGWVPSANFCRVIQSALYCKGYDGGEIDGICNERVQTAVAVLSPTWV